MASDEKSHPAFWKTSVWYWTIYNENGQYIFNAKKKTSIQVVNLSKCLYTAR